MSMAIKYAMQKRMAKGGCPGPSCPGCSMCSGGMMAEGGFIEEEKDDGYRSMPMDDEKNNKSATMEDDDMISRIMRQRYSKGGMVANDTPVKAGFEKNEFDDLVKDDDVEFSDMGANSGNQIGDSQEDEDRHDIVSRIMRSRAKRDRMPRPA